MLSFYEFYELIKNEAFLPQVAVRHVSGNPQEVIMKIKNFLEFDKKKGKLRGEPNVDRWDIIDLLRHKFTNYEMIYKRGNSISDRCDRFEFWTKLTQDVYEKIDRILDNFPSEAGEGANHVTKFLGVSELLTANLLKAANKGWFDKKTREIDRWGKGCKEMAPQIRTPRIPGQIGTDKGRVRSVMQRLREKR